MKLILITTILLFSVTFAVGSDKGALLYQNSIKYLGVQEGTENGKKIVLQFLANSGIKYMTSWCAAYVGYNLTEVGIVFPKTRSALAYHYINKQSIDARKVLRENIEIPQGTLAVWRRGTTTKGHIGITEKWRGRYGITIEGNTSGPSGGSVKKQYDGDGVYRKNRSIQPANYFRIVSFTMVK